MTTASVNLGEPTGSIGVGDPVIVVQGKGYGIVPVTRVVILPKGSADWPTAVRRDMSFAVVIETAYGYRYIGADRAAIESDLRVHWTRTDTRGMGQ